MKALILSVFLSLVVFCDLANGQKKTVSVAGIVVDTKGNPAENVSVALHTGEKGGVILGSDKTNQHGVYNIVSSEQLSESIDVLVVGCEHPNRGLMISVELKNAGADFRRGKPSPLTTTPSVGWLNQKNLEYALASVYQTEHFRLKTDEQTAEQTEKNIERLSAELLARYKGGHDIESIGKIAEAASRIGNGLEIPVPEITSAQLGIALGTKQFTKAQADNQKLELEFRNFVAGQGEYKAIYSEYATSLDTETIDIEWISSIPMVSPFKSYVKLNLPERATKLSIMVTPDDRDSKAWRESYPLSFVVAANDFAPEAMIMEWTSDNPEARQFLLFHKLLSLENYPDLEKAKLTADMPAHQFLIDLDDDEPPSSRHVQPAAAHDRDR